MGSHLIPEGPIAAVASTLERAEALAYALERAGWAAGFATDLGEVLESEPALLLIDPSGWEHSCYALLDGFELRNALPPAVLLVGDDDLVLHRAGPALERIASPLSVETLQRLCEHALERRRALRFHWPHAIRLGRATDISRVENAMAEATGIVVRADRRQAFLKGLQSRIVARLLPSVLEYERLLAGPEGAREMELLVAHVVVGETYFWRYAGQLHALKGLLAARSVLDRPLRIWCAGCSTGEEVYSVAIAAREALGGDGAFEVVGTDINPMAIAAAREGRYGAHAVRNLSAGLLSRWFKAAESRYQVRDELRERVRFETFNLCADDAPTWAHQNGPFDAVFCRNVTIYFSHPRTERVVRLCLDALTEGGGLFLGSAEALYPVPEALEVHHDSGAYYYAKRGMEPPEPVRSVGREPQAPTRRTPDDAESGEELFRRGLKALGREMFPEAQELFEKLLVADPRCPKGNTGMAVLLANQGRELEARDRLKVALEQGDELVEAYHVLGLLEERNGEEERALDSYARALEIDAGFFMARFNRAFLFKRQGRSDDFDTEMRLALIALRDGSRHAANTWATGGLGVDAILGMVAEAVAGGGEGR